MVGDQILFIKQELWVLKQEGTEHEPGFHHVQKVVTYHCVCRWVIFHPYDMG